MPTICAAVYTTIISTVRAAFFAAFFFPLYATVDTTLLFTLNAAVNTTFFFSFCATIISAKRVPVHATELSAVNASFDST